LSRYNSAYALDTVRITVIYVSEYSHLCLFFEINISHFVFYFLFFFYEFKKHSFLHIFFTTKIDLLFLFINARNAQFFFLIWTKETVKTHKFHSLCCCLYCLQLNSFLFHTLICTVNRALIFFTYIYANSDC